MLFALSEDLTKFTQVAKVGKFKHPIYGKFDVTENDLDKMIHHLSINARRQKLKFNEVDTPVLPIDYYHEEEKIAAGWIKGLQKKTDSNGVKALFADVDWTPKGTQKIKDRELAFISPFILRNYEDAETGNIYDVILKGAALTNIPFLRDMEPAQALSEDQKVSMLYTDPKPKKGSNMPTFSEILEGLKSVSPEDKKSLQDAAAAESQKLSEDSGKLGKDLKKAQDDLKLSEKEKSDLKTKMSGSDEVEGRLKLSEGEVKDLKGKVLSLTKTMAEKEQKAEFDQMLSEGKTCEAQRKSFMSGNMAEFAKNAQEMKLAESGANATGDEKEGEAHDKVQKLAEEKMKADKNIDYGAAVSQVLSENPALNKSLYPED